MGIGTWWNDSKLNPQKWMKGRDVKAMEMVKQGKDVGVHIDFITWNTFIRPAVSLTAGFLVTTILAILSWAIDADLFDFWLYLASVAFFAYWVGMGQKEVETVPEGRMAMINWFGIPMRIYRQNGEYSWTGKRFGFGRVNVFKEPMTDEKGFFWTDVVQTNIWNVYEADASKRSNLLEALTKTGSGIKANLLVMIRMRDPMLWIRKNDPMMDIGERARMAFRTAIAFFTGKDVVSVKNLLTEMMSGHVVITCFLKEQEGTLARHSLIRDNGGDPMYESIRPGEAEESEKQKFLQRLEQQSDKKLLQKVIHDDAGKPIVERREISESLEEVLHACGVTLARASVGFISLPDEVVKSANQADSQPYQLQTQKASAQAAKEARDLLRPEEADRNDPTFADRQAFAASSDPDSRVKVIHVSGGGNGNGDSFGIKQAAAILAAALNKDDDKVVPTPKKEGKK